MRDGPREVDEALLGCYFGGVNSRRIRRALRPLLGEAHLSKSAVSRVVTRVKDQFAVWRAAAPCTDERYGVVLLDGFHLRVRLAGRVVTVPVLTALGVTDSGQKRLLAMQLAASDAAASWGSLLAKLQQRGLTGAVAGRHRWPCGTEEGVWRRGRLHTCSDVPPTRDAISPTPVPCLARLELRRDYHRLLYATDGLAARAAYDRLPEEVDPVVPTGRFGRLEEAGLELLTVLHLPEGDVEVVAHDQRVRESQS